VTIGYAKRDRFLVWAANRILRLTSKHYQQMTHGLIVYGMAAATRDEHEGVPLPPLPDDAYGPGSLPLAGDP
jgi:hypothetical protein